MASHNVGETSVEAEIKKFLKYAPERSGGGGRKKNEAVAVPID